MMQVDLNFIEWTVVCDQQYEGVLSELAHRHPNYYKKVKDFLISTPDRIIHDRVFPLMGKKYKGAWEYKEELPEGTFRLYYKLIPADRKVMIYYVGPKPRKSPVPPSDVPDASDNHKIPSQDIHRSGSKKGRNYRR